MNRPASRVTGLSERQCELARRQGEIAVRALVALFPILTPVMRESETDHGQVLPHLVMSDIIQWMASRVHTEPNVCRGVLNWMDTQLREGPEEVQELVVVSGVEMLPNPGETGHELHHMLPPTLALYDSWNHHNGETRSGS